MRLLYSILLIHFSVAVFAQKLIGLRTEYDDTFQEWVLVTADEDDFDGELSITFSDFTDWSFQLGELSGNIRQKWTGKDGTWEVYAEGETVVINRVWPGDNREWKLTSGKLRKTIRTRYGTSADEWRLSNEKDGFFDIFTEWEGDPRDWIIEENLNEDYSNTFKVALAFIAIYNSMPKQ